MKMFLKSAVLAAALGAMAIVPSANAAEEVGKPIMHPETNPVVAKVNEREITQQNLMNMVDTLLPLVSYHSSVSDTRLHQLQVRALNRIVEDTLIYEYAKGQDKTYVEEDDIDKKIEDIRERVPGGKSLEDMLETAEVTMDEFRKELTEDMVVSEVRTEKKEEFRDKAEKDVDEAFLRKYYKANMEKFRKPEQIHISEILFKADPAGGQVVWTAAKEKAMDVIKKARAGEDFAELAKEYSEDVYADQGGDMGWAHKGSISPEIEQVADNLKVGEVGGPVLSIYGYHVVRLNGKKPAVQLSFEEIDQEKLTSELVVKEAKRLWDEWIDGLRGKASIEYYTDIKPDAGK